MSREIQLAGGLTTLVDDEDYEWASRWTWSFSNGYAFRRGSIKKGESAKKYFYLHRVIAGTAIGFLTDHINGNTLDNRRANLRTCTRAQNSWNRRLGRDNTSGFKGVSLTRSGKWEARIWRDGKKRYLGTFDSPEAAYAVYCYNAKEAYGEFANLGTEKSTYGIYGRRKAK